MNDPWGRHFFKTGVVLLFVLGLIHSLSLLRPLVPANDTERQLLELANDYQFNLMGSHRSLWVLFRGFNICFTLAMLGLGALNATLWRHPSPLLKRASLVTVLWLGAMLAVSLRYFFIFPTSLIGLSLLVFLLAWALLARAPSN